MNTGAEAVETAIKVARKWGYQVKGVPDGQATIVVADGNFHGRTTTIVSFSTDPDARADFGPYTPGFRIVPVRRPGRAGRRRSTRPPSPCCIEPIQGEAGRARPAGRLPARRPRAVHRAATCCSSPTRSSPGLGRTGDTFACDHEGVVPDLYVLGKALGGGIVPVSAVVGERATCSACCAPASTARRSAATRSPARSALAVVELLATGEFQARARDARRAPARAAATRWSATAWPPSAAAACGPASTSTRR